MIVVGTILLGMHTSYSPLSPSLQLKMVLLSAIQPIKNSVIPLNFL